MIKKINISSQSPILKKQQKEKKKKKKRPYQCAEK